MEQTRVILVEMPRILREIVRGVVSAQPDIVVLDDGDEALQPIRAGAACVAITHPDDPRRRASPAYSAPKRWRVGLARRRPTTRRRQGRAHRDVSWPRLSLTPVLPAYPRVPARTPRLLARRALSAVASTAPWSCAVAA